MNLYKAGYELAKLKPSSGLSHFVRLDGVKLGQLGRRFLRAKATPKPLRRDENVVVVGGGVAGFSLCEGLYLRGHRHVTLVTEKGLFGGKCVQYGCMLSEYLDLCEDHHPYSWDEAEAVVSGLASSIEAKIKEWGFALHINRIGSVEGNTIVFEDGRRLSYDRLVFATGSRNKTNPLLRHYSCWSLSDFWRKTCQRLLIITSGNPAALSLADLAASMGRHVTLVCSTPNFGPLEIPSMQYFAKAVRSRGVTIEFNVSCVEHNKKIGIQRSSGFEYLDTYDAVLPLDYSEPALPSIPGFRSVALDYEFETASLIPHSNIYLLGEAAGMFSASESELHSQLLLDSWFEESCINGLHFESLPWRFHAKRSLAGVGKPWTFFAETWEEIDFAALGWSMLHGEQGKLWYIFNRKSRKIEALHICHKEASRLIAMASLLLDYTIDDLRWRQFFIHPEASEIFKLLCYKIRSRYPKSASVKIKNLAVLELPNPGLAREDSFYKTNFTKTEVQRALMDRDPALYFASMLVLKRHHKPATTLLRDKVGKLALNSNEHFNCWSDELGYLIECDDQMYRVRLES